MSPSTVAQGNSFQSVSSTPPTTHIPPPLPSPTGGGGEDNSDDSNRVRIEYIKDSVRDVVIVRISTVIRF